MLTSLSQGQRQGDDRSLTQGQAPRGPRLGTCASRDRGETGAPVWGSRRGLQERNAGSSITRHFPDHRLLTSGFSGTIPAAALFFKPLIAELS